MTKILTRSVYSFTIAAERAIVHDLEEKLSYIVMFVDMEIKAATESTDKEET